MNDAPGAFRFYAYRMPRSKILEMNITKEKARRLVACGVFPVRSIWIPGCVGEGERPDIGDLFEADETWRPARRILSKAEKLAREQGAIERDQLDRFGPDHRAIWEV